MTDRAAIQEVLRADRNLGLAPPAVLDELADNAQRLRFEKGEYVFRAGDEASHYYAMESGRVVLSKESPSGKNFTYLIAVRGMTLNAVTCFRPRPRFFSARVAEPSTVISIPSAIFRKSVLSCPTVAAAIFDELGGMLDGAYTRILDIIDESAETRILNALSMLCSRIGPELPLTNTDVAEMTGVSRETAARVVSRIQEAGLIAKSRGTIQVLDPDQLEDLATSPFFLL